MADDDMDALQERVIKLEARTDRHGDVLRQLEVAGKASEIKISELADALKTMVTMAKTVMWVGGLLVVAQQSGILSALRVAIGL